MNDQTSSDPDANRREFWEPIGQFVMEFGFLERQIDGIIWRALFLHEMQGEALTSQIRNLSTRIHLAQRLLLILHTNTAQPKAIERLMATTIKLNKFRNDLVHGPWGLYDMTHQFWEKTSVTGHDFKPKMFRVKRQEILDNINRTRETREALAKLTDSVVREYLTEHGASPGTPPRRPPRGRKTPRRTQ